MGMFNAYQVADEMMKDKMKEKGMYNDYKDINNADIVIIRGQYDHIENVFSGNDMEFSCVNSYQLSNAQLNKDQILFINCPGNLERNSLQKIHDFVEEGGFLFTTDWALKNVIETTFPGYIEYNRKATGDEVVRVEVLSKDDDFLQTLLSDKDDPQWWLEGSSYPIACALATTPIRPDTGK